MPGTASSALADGLPLGRRFISSARRGGACSQDELGRNGDLALLEGFSSEQRQDGVCRESALFVHRLADCGEVQQCCERMVIDSDDRDVRRNGEARASDAAQSAGRDLIRVRIDGGRGIGAAPRSTEFDAARARVELS